MSRMYKLFNFTAHNGSQNIDRKISLLVYLSCLLFYILMHAHQNIKNIIISERKNKDTCIDRELEHPFIMYITLPVLPSNILENRLDVVNEIITNMHSEFLPNTHSVTVPHLCQNKKKNQHVAILDVYLSLQV